MKPLLFLLLLFASTSLYSIDLSKRYPKGEGSAFDLDVMGINTKLYIYISESSKNSVGIEMYFQSILAELWQQTLLKVGSQGKVSPSAAYLLTKGMKAPEQFTMNQLPAKGGLQLNDFLLPDKKALEQWKVGSESVTTPAGAIKATHYRKKAGDQTIDFWISDEAKPIGLVKLESAGKKYTYRLLLKSLLKNVKRKINPKLAVPLSKKGKDLMGLTKNIPLLP